MSSFIKYASIGLLGLILLVPAASAQRGRVFIGAGFGPGYGWYGPYSYWGPYGYYGPAYGPSSPGQVKLVTQNKDAQVYVDGGFAGTAGKLKKFWLAPGQHDIELRDASGNVLHQEHVTVIPGKTVDINGAYAPPKT
jgi:hypothetical protein